MEKILQQFAKPLIHRLAGWIGVTLATLGFATDEIQTVLAAVTIVAGFLVDLVVRRIF